MIEDARASIEFLCGREIDDDEALCVPIAVSEFSLADLVGQPHLLERVERSSGCIEFRYKIEGALYPHLADQDDAPAARQRANVEAASVARGGFL